MRNVLAAAGRRVWKSLTGQTANKLFVGTCLIAIGAAAPSTVNAIERRFNGSEPPALRNVSEFVPAGFFVAEQLNVDMDGAAPPETVLHLAGIPEGTDEVRARVLVVAWDGATGRWGSVFDSSRRRLEHEQSPLISPDAAVEDLRLLPLAARDTYVDVAVSATVAGDGLAAIVSFDGLVARLAFGKRTGIVSAYVVGEAPRQRLRVKAWRPAPPCCSSGTYEAEFAPAVPHRPLGYHLVSDTRPLLGITLQQDDDVSALVVEVDYYAPARDLIRRGDVLLAVRRGHPGDLKPGYRDVITQLRGQTAGDVVTITLRRKGRELTLPMTLASRGGALLRREFRYPVLGGRLTTGPRGVVVREVDGALAAAGIAMGDRIVAVDGARVRRPAELLDRMRTAYEGWPKIHTCSKRSGWCRTRTVTRRMRLEVARGGRTRAIRINPPWRTFQYDEAERNHFGIAVL